MEESIDIKEYYLLKKDEIDLHLNKLFSQGYLGEFAKYILEGGKRLRGVLTILVCESLGGESKEAVDMSVAVELAHSASLAFDDILDLDNVRREKMAAWTILGLRRAVLAGHILITQAQHMLEAYGMKAIKVFIQAWSEATKGELADLFSSGLSIGKIYEEIASAKTAALFRAAASLGAIAAEADTEMISLAGKYGKAIGMAYQIADDTEDILKTLEKKQIARDPVTLAFLRYLGIRTRSVDWEIARKAAEGKIEGWISKAENFAEYLPESSHKKIISRFPLFCVEKLLKT